MKTQTAFTLVELMVALALAAILVVVALPSMRYTLVNSQITTKSTDFVRALNYARGQAISSAQLTTIDPIDQSKWGKGWRVVDKSKDSSKVANDNDERIKSQVKFDDDITIDMVKGPASLSALKYDSRGQLILSTEPTSITFWVCNKNYPQLHGREITIRPIGTVTIKRCSKYPCA